MSRCARAVHQRSIDSQLPAGGSFGQGSHRMLLAILKRICRRALLRRLGTACSLGIASFLPAAPSVAETEPAGLEVHAQATYVRQLKPSFEAAYTGPKSLSPNREYGYSFTATIFL